MSQGGYKLFIRTETLEPARWNKDQLETTRIRETTVMLDDTRTDLGEEFVRFVDYIYNTKGEKKGIVLCCNCGRETKNVKLYSDRHFLFTHEGFYPDSMGGKEPFYMNYTLILQDILSEQEAEEKLTFEEALNLIMKV